MKPAILLSATMFCCLPALADAQQPFSFDVNAGTQGAGISIGYKLNPSVRLRLRGAVLGNTSNENWSGTRAELKLCGNNVGLLVDMFPGQGNFYISAGLNFSENKMRCRSRIYRVSDMAASATLGGTEYTVTEGTHADIHGKYSWNHAQPYIGIGYQSALFGSNTFYYSADLGINFMGSGELTVGSSSNLRYRDPATRQFKPVTDSVLETSIRKEGRDFFKIADDLCVYPVLQFALGARF